MNGVEIKVKGYQSREHLTGLCAVSINHEWALEVPDEL